MVAYARRTLTVFGTVTIVLGVLAEAAEHVEFIWSHIPQKYVAMIDQKSVFILILAGFIVLPLSRSASKETTTAPVETASAVHKPKPNLVFLNCRESNLAAIGVGGVLLAFRNDVLSFKDSARGVIAHISYSGSQNERIEVNYGVWVENEDYLTFDRSDTKHLIIALREGTRLYAAENIAPQTKFREHRMVEVGKLAPGEWMLKIRLTAENFKRDYECKLIVEEDGAVRCAAKQA